MDEDPIPGLIKLYSDNPMAMEDLARCRINPNIRSKQRRDLEFFIPQVCSFYLQDYYSNTTELVNFILNASGEFHFSHRVLFFFSAMIYEKMDPEKQKKQRDIIDRVVNQLISQINKFPEKLYLTSSQECERMWSDYGLGDFYPHIAIRQKDRLSPQILRLLQKRLKNVQAVIDQYTELGYHNEIASFDQVVPNRVSVNNQDSPSED